MAVRTATYEPAQAGLSLFGSCVPARGVKAFHRQFRVWGANNGIRASNPTEKRVQKTGESPVVCTDNSMRVDLVTQSLNVGGDARADMLLPDAVRLAVQVEEST